MFAIDKFLAWTIAAACAVLLVRLCLGERRRHRFDQAVRRAWQGTRRRVMRAVHWRRHRRSAEQAAQEAIQRARHGVERKGNVYTPKSFNKPRKPH